MFRKLCFVLMLCSIVSAISLSAREGGENRRPEGTYNHENFHRDANRTEFNRNASSYERGMQNGENQSNNSGGQNPIIIQENGSQSNQGSSQSGSNPP